MKESGASVQDLRKFAIEEMVSFHEQHSIGVNDLKRYHSNALAGSNDLKLADLAQKAGVDFEKSDSLRILGNKAAAAGRPWAGKFMRALEAIQESRLVKLLRRVPGVKYLPAALTGVYIVMSDASADAKTEMSLDALDPTGFLVPVFKGFAEVARPESLKRQVELFNEFIPGLRRLTGPIFSQEEHEEMEERERIRNATRPP